LPYELALKTALIEFSSPNVEAASSFSEQGISASWQATRTTSIRITFVTGSVSPPNIEPRPPRGKAFCASAGRAAAENRRDKNRHTTLFIVTPLGPSPPFAGVLV
jgi:hypothetical protein